MSSAGLFGFQVPWGFYPQRPEIKKKWLIKQAENAIKSIHQAVSKNRLRMDQFIQRVDDYGTTLTNLSKQEIQEKLKALRFYARKHGTDERYLSEVFAIISEVSGRVLNMRHYRHQLIGGWAMMGGTIIEMDTGQGKSLCATLPVCAAALAGVPTHVITINEYLACRDAETFKPLYEALGLTVASVTEEMSEDDKRIIYQSDVVYCTNKQIAFDYLRDRIATNNDGGGLRLQLESLYSDQPRQEKLMLRGLNFAIVDEADSVLVDEAVTPLIISASKSQSDKRPVYEKAILLAKQLQDSRDFILKAEQRSVILTEDGKRRLDHLGGKLGGLWRGPCPREELVVQALKAQHLFIKNQHYLVDEGKIQIIDEFTGRVMADRSWGAGLHQMVEAKEGCELTDSRETLARISYQRFFRRYVNLAGMTGTANEVKNELKAVYNLNVFRVQPAKAPQKIFLPTIVCNSETEKWQHVINRIKELNEQRRPVLVGTRTLRSSMILSELLQSHQLNHYLLNPHQAEQEAEIVSRAGEPGSITVATNMAGRGTDIKLPQDALELGGLHVISTEKHEARRIDRQLYGRCGRQGDPGSVEIVLSLEDEIVTNNYHKLILKFANHLQNKNIPLIRDLIKVLFTVSQLSVEKRQYHVRKNVLKIDEQQGRLLAFSGRME